MGSGFAKKKKQAKLLQDKMMKMQEEMEVTEVMGQSGNGLVEIILTGSHELKSIKIKPECIDPEDAEGLQDLIKAAYNDANKQLEKKSGMPDLSTLGFPGMMGM